MAKIVRHLRDGQSEFQKVFANLCNTKSAWQAWSDFVEMTAIAISNSCEIRGDVRQDREQRYLSIIGSYTKQEQMLFPELLRILTESLERNSEQDFLGEMFMALELGSHWKGQFFTPYSVCKMMATVTVSNAPELLKKKQWVGIHDPACGAGATLIGARNALELMKIGGTQAFFIGQDIDRTAAMMCYIQLSLLGCAGYVVIADTLVHPVTGPLLWPNLTEHQEAWFMPMNFLDLTWVLRLSRTWRGLDTDEEPVGDDKSSATQAVAEIATAASKEPEPKPLPKKQRKGKSAAKKAAPLPVPMMDTESGQLTLF